MPLPLAKARRGLSPQPEPQPQPARSTCRSQLEQDVSHRSPLPPPMPTLTHALTWNARAPAQVKRLRKALQEETALHAVLEGALGRAAVTLADMAYLPTNVCPHARSWFGLAWLPRRRSLTLDGLSSLSSAGAGAALQHLHPRDRGHEAGGGDGLPALPAHPGEEREAARRVPPQAPPPAAVRLLLPLRETRTRCTNFSAHRHSCSCLIIVTFI